MGTHPTRHDCDCAPCRAHRAGLWQRATPVQRRAIMALAHGPRTPRDLRANARIQLQTLEAMARVPELQRLIRPAHLRQWTNDHGTLFFTLTRMGAAALRAGIRMELGQ